jgi:hypothetical protein
VQPCPVAGGTISGTFDADDVIGPADQGIAAGEFDELLRAMRAGKTYVNIHTVTALAAKCAARSIRARNRRTTEAETGVCPRFRRR